VLFSTMFMSCTQAQTKTSTTTTNTKLQIFYFHSTNRCITCNSIENNAKLLLQESFKTEMDNGIIKFASYNIDEDANKALVEKYQIGFYYQDFRSGWQEGIEKAIEINLYRQAYCGCIYSEQERYDKAFTKKKQTIKNS